MSSVLLPSNANWTANRRRPFRLRQFMVFAVERREAVVDGVRAGQSAVFEAQTG